MEDSRTRKSAKNIFAAVILKIFGILLPFILRTIIIKSLGIEYVGLSGLFSSIIGVLSLAEMGAGAALVYAMYEPIKEKNNEKLCAIICLYRKIYISIGLFVGILGMLVVPFLDRLIKAGTYPNDINIQLLYIVYLVNTIITYLVFAYKTSLLDAHQAGFKASCVKIKMLLVQYCLQIGVLLYLKNYYAYIIVMPICTLVTCIWTGIVADKSYPDLKPQGKLPQKDTKEIISKIKSLFLYKIGSVVLNSVDSIVISWYFGAMVLGIYNNYYYIVSSLFSILLAVGTAITPSVGNSMVSKTLDENYKDFMMFSAGYNWIVGWCCICIVCLIQPFIKLWIGIDNQLPFGYAIMFGIYVMCFRIGDVVGWYKDVAGLWEPDKYRPLLSSVVNLTLNIILIQIIGLYGVLLSTILSLAIINYPIAVRVIIKHFNKPLWPYVKQQLFSILVITVSLICTLWLCTNLKSDNDLLHFLISICICLVVPNIIMCICFFKNSNVKDFLSFVNTRFLKH